MARRVKVKLNSAGMAQLLRDPGVQADLQRRGDAVLAAAKSSSPVLGGNYQASLHTEAVTTDRATVRVVAGTDHGLLVQAQTGHLARALDAGRG